MRTSTLFAAVLATAAMATPVKRDVVYQVVEVQTITEYVYATAETPAPVQDSHPEPAAEPAVVAEEPKVPTPTPTSSPAPPSSTPAAKVVDSYSNNPAPPKPADVYQTNSKPAAPKPAEVYPTSDKPAAKPAEVYPTNNGGGLPGYDPNLQVSDPGFEQAALAYHNVHRTNHTAPALVYNHTMAPFAQQKAEECVWNEEMPSGLSGVGMNIAQGTYQGPANISNTISELWYNCEFNYYTEAGGWGNKDPNVSGAGSTFVKWGHLTQVVWAGTKSVACGSAACGPQTSISSGYFTVCMYYPPGNYMGSFDQVHQPQGKATVKGV